MGRNRQPSASLVVSFKLRKKETEKATNSKAVTFGGKSSIELRIGIELALYNMCQFSTKTKRKHSRNVQRQNDSVMYFYAKLVLFALDPLS